MDRPLRNYFLKLTFNLRLISRTKNRKIPFIFDIETLPYYLLSSDISNLFNDNVNRHVMSTTKSIARILVKNVFL